MTETLVLTYSGDGLKVYVSLSTPNVEWFSNQITHKLDAKTRKLVLEPWGVSSTMLSQFLQAIKANRNISRVKVVGLFDVESAAAIVKEINMNAALRHLSLVNSGVDCNILAIICDELRMNTTLEKLNLSNIRCRGLRALAQFLSHNKTLLNVKLHRMRLEDEKEAMRFYETICDKNYTLLRISAVPQQRADMLVEQLGLTRVIFPYEFLSFVQLRLNEMCKRNLSLRWPIVHALIVDIVVALASAPLNLPAYVLLWIIDWLPHLDKAHSELKKIRLIERVVESIRRVKSRR